MAERDRFELDIALALRAYAEDAPTEVRPAELARRLAQVEAALARTRGRRAVRLADAARRVQRGRTWADVKAAAAMLRRDGRV